MALSQSAAWWFTPVGFMGPLLVDPARLGGSTAFWLAVAFVGQLVVVAGFWLGSRALPHLPRRFAPTGTLAVVFAVVVVRGVTIGWIVQAAGYSDGLELAYRTVGSIPLIGGALITSGLVVCARSEHRAVMRALRQRRDELVLAQASLDGRLAEIREQLRRQIRDTLEPRIHELEAALDAAAAGRASVPLTELRSLVDDDLRGLIRELARERAAPDFAEPPSRAAASSRVRLPATMTVSNALRPALQGAMVGAAATASVIRALPAAPAMAYCLILAVLTAGGLFLGRLVLGRWVAPTVLALATTSALGAVTTFTAVTITDFIGVPSPGFLGAAAFAYGAACALALAIYAAVDDHRTTLETDLADTVAELECSTSTLQRRAWVARRRLSLLLHGSVQGALHAAVLRLGSRPEPDPEDIVRAKNNVAAAFSLLDAPSTETVELGSTLDSIRDTWAGHCAITWNISDEARSRLDSDDETRECVAEIAREGTHNAIVHGRATVVFIEITGNGGGIGVSVRDNGRPAEGVPGTGTAMLDEMCSTWSRSTTTAGTVLLSELV